MLKEIALSALLWVCSNSDYHCSEKILQNIPRIEVSSEEKIEELAKQNSNNFLAFYIKDNNTIIINEKYNNLIDSITIEEILIHELVHYLQNINNKQFNCLAETEKEAYNIQVEWQKQNNKNQWISPLFLVTLDCNLL